MSALYDAFVAYAKANPTLTIKPGDKPVSWNQNCAYGMSRFQNYLGGWVTEPRTFGPNAVTVGRNSQLHDFAVEAPIGAHHWWSIGGDGHVGIDLNGGGTDIGMMGTAKLATQFHPFIGIQSVWGYGTETYMGWSMDYAGGVGRRPVEPPPVVLLPTQRRVGTINSRRRDEPSITSPYATIPLPAKSVQDVEGWANGDLYGAGPWFSVGDKWSHSSTFTDAGTHDLVDLNPVEPPVIVPEPEPVPVEPAPVEPTPEPVEPEPVEPTPNWFIRFITALIDAFTRFLGGPRD